MIKDNKLLASKYEINTDISNSESLTNNDIVNMNNLVNMIINNYDNFPNYSHFYNIETIFNFLFKDNFETNESMTEKDEILKLYNDEEIQIDIEYENNINSKTKLFGKSFVNNNIQNCYLKIKEEKYALRISHNFDTKEKIVSIKLIIKKEILNINFSKMFSNCYNLKSLVGISRLGKIKIINLNKMFFNCISLKSLPDISEWDVSYVKNASLMFYNCISLKPFPDLKKWNINDNLFLNSSLLFFNSFLISLKKNEIDSQNIIGEGTFGIVVKEIISEKDEKGNNKNIEVAAKYIKSQSLLKKGKIKLLINLFKESGMMVNLNHKNIVKLISIRPSKTKIIMEYMKGGNLSNVLYNNKNLSLQFKIYCLFEICNGLELLHEKNIIHGDLKSINILLDKKYNGDDNYPTLKLSDFGLSGIKEDICPGQTPGFSAPELYEINMNNRTIKADIYSFGAVVYEIFKGESPIKNIKIDNNIRRKFYPLPDIKNENWPEKIKEIIFDCCKKNYKERPTIELIKKRIVKYCIDSNNEKLIQVKEKCTKFNFYTLPKFNDDNYQIFKTIEASNLKYREFIYKNKNELFNGYGIHTFEDGAIYKGLFENGKINKDGKFIYNNNIIYEGQHKEGIWNGIGKLINKSNNSEYNGYFKDFKYNGYGIIYFNKDKAYNKNFTFQSLEGEYKKGIREGIGILKGSRAQYTGEFKNGHLGGIGIFKYANGDICQGEFIN